jgi:hypothetical protein
MLESGPRFPGPAEKHQPGSPQISLFWQSIRFSQANQGR